MAAKDCLKNDKPTHSHMVSLEMPELTREASGRVNISLRTSEHPHYGRNRVDGSP